MTKNQAEFPHGWDAVVVSVNFIREVEGASAQEMLEENALRYWAVSQERTDEVSARGSSQKPVLLIALGKGDGAAANEVLEVFHLTRTRRGDDGVEFERAATPLPSVAELRQALVGKELTRDGNPIQRPQGVNYIGAWAN